MDQFLSRKIALSISWSVEKLARLWKISITYQSCVKTVNPYSIPVQRLKHNHIIMRQEKRAMRKNIPGTHTRGVLGRCWVVDRIGQGGWKSIGPCAWEGSHGQGRSSRPPLPPSAIRGGYMAWLALSIHIETNAHKGLLIVVTLWWIIILQ